MSKELPFIILCLEEYKNRKGLTGEEVIDLFNGYSVCEYLQTFYDALHTMGTECVLRDIEEYIESRKAAHNL